MLGRHHCCGDYAREEPYRRKSEHIGAIALIFVALFVPGCSSNEDVLGDTDQNSATGGAELQLAVSPLELEARRISLKAAKDRKEQAELRSNADKAMEAVLFDPSSAQYVDLRAGRGGAICGKVNAKNRYGAYVGFKDFVVRNGEVELSGSNDGVETERYGSFAQAYLAACATAADRKKHEAATSITAGDLVVENLTAENLVLEDDYDPFAE